MAQPGERDNYMPLQDDDEEECRVCRGPEEEGYVLCSASCSLLVVVTLEPEERGCGAVDDSRTPTLHHSCSLEFVMTE